MTRPLFETPTTRAKRLVKMRETKRKRELNESPTTRARRLAKKNKTQKQRNLNDEDDVAIVRSNLNESILN